MHKVRLLAAVVTAGVAGLVGVASALADSATGNQNATFTVTVSATSDGADPNVATDGDKITVDMSVTNVTAAAQYVRIVLATDFPKGHDINHIRKLSPGETWTASRQFKVNGEKIPAAIYSFTLQGYGGGIVIYPSEATAHISVQ